MAERKSQFASDVTIPVTVPAFLFDAMAKATSREFALSYLFGAEMGGRVITPRTFIAYERILASPKAMGVLDHLELILGRPDLFGSAKGSTVTLHPKDGTVIGESASYRQRTAR